MFHLSIGMYMYSRPDLFPESETSIKDNLNTSLNNLDPAMDYIFFNRDSEHIYERVKS